MSELDDVIEELEHNEERRLIAESKLSKKIIQCKTLQAERDRLREALQNIADGDTPWMDGYSETPGEVYQKYAKSIIDNVG